MGNLAWCAMSPLFFDPSVQRNTEDFIEPLGGSEPRKGPLAPMSNRAVGDPDGTLEGTFGKTEFHRTQFNQLQRVHNPNVETSFAVVNRSEKIFSGETNHRKNDANCAEIKDVSDVSERLKQARERAGLSLNALERKAGLAHTMAARIERGATKSRISGDTFEKLAKALNVRLEWLISGVEPMENEGEEKPISDANQTKAIPKHLLDDGDKVGDWVFETSPVEEEDLFEDGLPIYGNVPGWKQAEIKARLASALPLWCFQAARHARGALQPPNPMTPEFVLSVAQQIWETTKPDLRDHLINKSLQRQLSRSRSSANQASEKSPTEK